jgi:hypothetical protein
LKIFNPAKASNVEANRKLKVPRPSSALEEGVFCRNEGGFQLLRLLKKLPKNGIRAVAICGQR